MLFAISCMCGNVGFVAGETLPRLLTCSKCQRRELFRRDDAWPVVSPYANEPDPQPSNSFHRSTKQMRRRRIVKRVTSNAAISNRTSIAKVMQ